MNKKLWEDTYNLATRLENDGHYTISNEIRDFLKQQLIKEIS